MTTYTYPSTSQFRPQGFDIGLRSSVIVSTSSLNGSTQTVEISGPRWVCSLHYGSQSLGDRAAVEGFWSAVRGQVNRVSLWHLSRPAPRGTMRGSPVLTSAVAVGDTSIAITTTAYATLLSGDMIGVGAQILQVTADATATAGGALTVSVSPPARSIVSGASSVVWDKPSAVFLMSQRELIMPYDGAALAAPFSVDLMEIWT